MAARSGAIQDDVAQSASPPRKRPPRKIDAGPPRPKGFEVPRIYTPPLRRLTKKTSLGFEFIDWAKEHLDVDMLPYQRWLSIHALELLPSGRLRFRTVLVLIGRQSGKSSWAMWLTLFLMATGRAKLVLGSAQDVNRAQEQWSEALYLTQESETLSDMIGRVRLANGQQDLRLKNGTRYRITAANRSAGRGLSVDLLLLDELREWRDFSAWSALSKTTSARPNGMILVTSNAGDEESVVLNQLRNSISSGGNAGVGIFEWSAPDDSEITDWNAIAQGLPGLGYTVTYEAVESMRALDPPGVFRTEVMCQWVASIDTPINPQAWEACGDPGGTHIASAEHKYFCLDVAPDGAHATLAAATVGSDGKVRVGIVDAWDDIGQVRDYLPDLIEEWKPRQFAWFPGGPAAALMADLLTVKRRVELKTADVPAVCQGFAEQVHSRNLVHGNDPLLTAHVLGSRQMPAGDGWRFVRRGGNADAAYAAAGAVHLARVTKPPPKLQLLVSTESQDANSGT